jgi:hypothetical protein
MQRMAQIEPFEATDRTDNTWHNVTNETQGLVHNEKDSARFTR